MSRDFTVLQLSIQESDTSQIVFGIVNLFKPAGLSSRTALNQLLRLLPKKTKAGHAGTLDPLATGVLLVCIGSATRLISRIQTLEKVYVGTFRLGYSSDSWDSESPYSPTGVGDQVSAAEIEQLLPQFTGCIEQVPPIFSALKVNGKRAYELARRGQPVEMKPRRVVIHELTLLEFDREPPTLSGPHGPIDGTEMKLEIRCGSGTYVRSIGHDVAAALGTRAIMTSLKRTAIGPFKSCSATRLEQHDRETILREVTSPSSAILLPEIKLSHFEVEELAFGRAITKANADAAIPEFKGVDDEGNLIAILNPRPNQPNKLHPTLNFANRYSSPDRRNT